MVAQNFSLTDLPKFIFGKKLYQMNSKMHCSPFISFVETQVRSCCDFVGLEILIDSECDVYKISKDIDDIEYGNFTFKGIYNVISFLSIICNEENSILLE